MLGPLTITDPLRGTLDESAAPGPQGTTAATPLARAWDTAKPFVYLAVPFVFYLIPLCTGHAWNALDPWSPRPTGMAGYHGRLPDTNISVEWYGTGVVMVPFQARLRQYLHSGDLPLWNPYQGLGQPFAAQGEGCPYFPFAILRSLLPYSMSNEVTFLVYYLSSVFLYLFLRGLGLGRAAAVFGGITWGLSGALSLHVARPILADQVAMIPVLFWAAAKAMRERTAPWYGVLAAAAALHLLAGFVQIALTPAALLIPFCILYGRLLNAHTRDWVRDVLVAVGVFVLGNGLASFHLLPMAEAMHTLYNKNVEHLAFIAMPYPNLVAFFFPYAFGQMFQSWVPGVYPTVTDWNNLFAYAGCLILLVNVMGWCLRKDFSRRARRLFCFFSLCGAFLLLRYVSFPPIAAVNWLPILGRQSPKHANGTIVFCFAVGAALAAPHLRSGLARTCRWHVAAALAMAASCVLTLVAQHGGFHQVDRRMALVFVAVTVLIAGVAVGCLYLARRWNRLTPAGALVVLTAAMVAELTLYLPLGNGSWTFLCCWRVGVFLLVVLSGLLFALGMRVTACGTFAAALAAYTALIVAPATGLPERFEIDQPPPYMTWLRTAAGQNYRVFGITPDYSSIAPLQDIEVVGPMAPKEYVDFIDLISSGDMAAFYRGSSTFWLTRDPRTPGVPEYDFKQYLKARPVLDWMGVRYLVLDRDCFGPGRRRHDHRSLLARPDANIRAAYEDDRVTLLESATAAAKAVFAPAVRVRADRKAVVAELQRDPKSILGPPLVERGATSCTTAATSAAADGPPAPVAIESYRPNRVCLAVDATGPGVVVLKDCYAPGWTATVNGKPAPVFRVNGMVRGVEVPQAGHYDVTFSYRPRSFTYGLVLAAVIAVFLLAGGTAMSLGRSGLAPRWTMVAGIALIVATAGCSAAAYYGVALLSRFGS